MIHLNSCRRFRQDEADKVREQSRLAWAIEDTNAPNQGRHLDLTVPRHTSNHVSEPSMGS